MNYKEAIDYIHSLNRFGSKPGLERTKYLAERLGNPQKHLKFIHVAGTNGKGSTAAYISSILTCAGYATGLYTSPYFIHFNERIRMNEREITDSELAEYVTRVKQVVDKMVEEGQEQPTEFEVITALAFLYYHEKKCDVVVLEVGLGGRFDATNIIDCPVLSVITKISLDHQTVLGDTLSDIAFEKAGIIKPGGSVVTYPQNEAAERVIEAVCGKRNARLFHANMDDISEIDIQSSKTEWEYRGYGTIKTSMVGVHQAYNAAVALKAVERLNVSGFSITKEEIIKGFERAVWPGRFELLRKKPDFYIDAAHNPDGIRAFIDTFTKIYPGKKAIVIFGVLKDKEYEIMIRELSAIAKCFIAVEVDNPRALPVDSLTKVLRKYCKNVEFSVTIKEAVEKSLMLANDDDIVASLGSLYYIGQVREFFTSKQ